MWCSITYHPSPSSLPVLRPNLIVENSKGGESKREYYTILKTEEENSSAKKKHEKMFSVISLR